MRHVQLDEPLRVAVCDMWRSDSPWHENELAKLLAKRFDLVQSDDPDLVVYSCFGQQFRRHRCRRLFYTGENRVPNRRECDVSMSFRPTTSDNYYLPIYKWYLRDDNFIPRRDLDEVVAGKSKFCNFVYSNPGATERREFFAELNARRRVDSGGRVLNNIGGPVDDKMALVRQCRFTIAFENERVPGYTTEKLVEAHAGRTVPIYWGDPDVVDVFNPDAFINCHDFPSFGAVADYVMEVDANPDLLRQYLAQPLFPGGGLPRWLEDDAILDWLVPRLAVTTRPVACSPVGLGTDTIARARSGLARAAMAARRLRRAASNKKGRRE